MKREISAYCLKNTSTLSFPKSLHGFLYLSDETKHRPINLFVRSKEIIKYWEDMQDKFGFSDGAAMPDGIEVYRKLYIQTINKLAEQLESQHRVVAYNRQGVHNYCLILMHSVQDLKDIPVEQYHLHVELRSKPPEVDEAMKEAIWKAHELYLDDYIRITVEIDADFIEFLDRLNTDKET